MTCMSGVGRCTTIESEPSITGVEQRMITPLILIPSVCLSDTGWQGSEAVEHWLAEVRGYRLYSQWCNLYNVVTDHHHVHC